LKNYPVGSIYITNKNTNPGTLFGGTWVAFGAGRTLVGVDSSQTEFSTIEKTGGAKTHKLTVDEMPSHNHGYYSGVWYFGEEMIGGALYSELSTTSPLFTRNSLYTGGSKAHNNLQPYITVYMWKRTA